MTATVRLATLTDAPTLARMRLAFRASTAPATENEAAFIERCEAWMAARLGGSGGWRAWVAELAGAPVGNLWLQAIEKLPNPAPEPERHAYITNVYVDPAHRGGIGQRLLEAALTWARSEGVDSVILWPTAGSRTLYARHGFAVRDDLMEAILDDSRLAHG